MAGSARVRGREGAAVGLALGLHLLALVVAPAFRRSPAGRTPSSQTPTAELEVDVSVEPQTQQHAPDDAPVPSEQAVASFRATEPRDAARGNDGHPSFTLSPAPPGSSAVADSPAGAWTFSPTRGGSLADISLGTERYQAPNDPAEVGPDRSADRIFAGTNDHDLALGLGRGGPIKSAIEEVVRDGDLLGTAMFDVTLDRAGVVRVDLVHAVGGSDVWERLREPIARLVAKKGVRLPEGHGLRVRVNVDAASKLADGRVARPRTTKARATVGEAGTESVAMKEMPNVGVEHSGALGSVKLAVGLNGGDISANTNFGTDNAGPGPAMAPGLIPLTIGGSFSPENIGSSPTRVVAARVVSETRL